MNKMRMSATGMAVVALTLLGFGAMAQTMITDVAGLQAMQGNLAGNYELANDIDASDTITWNGGAGFEPIGSCASVTPFTGTFDGAGYAITGLYINRPSTECVGLFGFANVATIQNVQLKDVHIHGDRLTGALAGDAFGYVSITQCSSTGTVTGSENTGGLVGYSDLGNVDECWSAVSVSASSGETGGLVGLMKFGSMTNCYSVGTVSGSTNVGGLVGYAEALFNDASITNCYSAGAVSGSSNVGGLLGGFHQQIPASVTLTKTYWDTETSGQATSAKQGPGASEGKTTAEMMQELTFDTWDFATVWGIYETQTYPYLRALSPYVFYVNIEQAVGQSDPTDALPILFDVLFAEPVTGFDSDDVSVSGTASGVRVALEGSGTLYTVRVFEVATAGTIEVSIPVAVCQTVANGGENSPSTSVDNIVAYTMPEQMPIAGGPVVIAMLAAGVAAIRRRRK